MAEDPWKLQYIEEFDSFELSADSYSSRESALRSRLQIALEVLYLDIDPYDEGGGRLSLPELRAKTRLLEDLPGGADDDEKAEVAALPINEKKPVPARARVTLNTPITMPPTWSREEVDPDMKLTRQAEGLRAGKDMANALALLLDKWARRAIINEHKKLHQVKRFWFRDSDGDRDAALMLAVNSSGEHLTSADRFEDALGDLGEVNTIFLAGIKADEEPYDG